MSRLRLALITLFALAALMVTSSLSPVLAQPRVDAAAGEAPPDVHEGEVGQLPPTPAGFKVELDGEVTWVYPSAASEEVRALRDVAPGLLAEVLRDLDDPDPQPMRISIARNPEEMAALAPAEAKPPEMASGVAYPALNLIILTLTAPGSWDRPDLPTVLQHELSHVALGWATQGKRVPRWFSEGVAVYQSKEFTLPRIKALWSASVSGSLIPIGELSRRFPTRSHEVNVAYAQSADLVAFLRRRDPSGAAFRELLERVRNGEPFSPSVTRAYNENLPALEAAWRSELAERFQALPLVLGGGTVWVLIVLLGIAAYARSRQRRRATLNRWAEEEALLDRLETMASRRAAPERSVEPVIPHFKSHLSPPPDPDIPTIDHEGQQHTLH